jgi:hypothetical protein
MRGLTEVNPMRCIACSIMILGSLAGAVPAVALNPATLRAQGDHQAGDMALPGENVTWELLGDIEVTSTSLGPLRTVFETRRNPQVEALDGQAIRIQGFLFPLETREAHDHFLLVPTPPGCPYCLPAGPTQMVEVFADQPVHYTQDPIVVTGTLSLLDNDPSGLHYRMHEAVAAAP